MFSNNPLYPVSSDKELEFHPWSSSAAKFGQVSWPISNTSVWTRRAVGLLVKIHSPVNIRQMVRALDLTHWLHMCMYLHVACIEVVAQSVLHSARALDLTDRLRMYLHVT